MKRSCIIYLLGIQRLFNTSWAFVKKRSTTTFHRQWVVAERSWKWNQVSLILCRKWVVKNLVLWRKKIISIFLFSYLVLQVDLNLKVNVDDVDQYIHATNNKKINVHGILNAMGVRTWDVNINIDMSQGHTVNNVKIQMTRETPGEKKLKVVNQTINNK